MQPAIAYIRVSRPRQGRSGLGLEAQQAAIVQFAKIYGYRTHRAVGAGTAGRQQGYSIGCTCDDRPAQLAGFDRPGGLIAGA